ncbi:MAG TPA: YfiR family protein [Steroidobacteraceae bacterium]|nr:YfiR family protein [Steroidobacteraceae bacterium]
MISFTAQAAESGYSPAAVKAAFLHRFASYVEWPVEAAPADTFIIAVSGADDVAEQLEGLLPGLKIQNRSARVRRVAAPDELEGAQILYIGSSVKRVGPLLAAAERHPILTVTDSAEGLATGSVINFVQVGRNIRFEVSLPAAERSRLRIDSGLLSVAARVEEQPRAGLWQDRRFFARRKERAPGIRDRGNS